MFFNNDQQNVGSETQAVNADFKARLFIQSGLNEVSGWESCVNADPGHRNRISATTVPGFHGLSISVISV